MNEANGQPGAKTLLQRIQEPRILVAMGVHDGLTARIAERAGFEAFYHGGYAVAAHQYGLPDIGMIALHEMVESLGRVTGVSSVPVITDADTGYGEIAGVRRSVQELERAGAAAIQIEDQVFPKRCGHMEGKEVIPRDEMVLKVRAAVGARSGADLLIVARTDALQPNDLDDAIDRCNAYADAGADVVFVDAPGSEEELAEIADRVDGLSLANMSETGRTPVMSAEELERMGYRIVIFPSPQTRIIARAYEDLCTELADHGTTRGVLDRMMPFEDVNRLLGLEEWQRLPS
ncbi:MAG: isocitrate lyase/phosphoenolpyruvate mutase family protein [Thermoleophilia bacterium]|jgi:2-methylisocitrate lyase-like PEP mutase family enzyme|nr:isocitrate lyase/phosphoenolpyruvate mutase family protein [Thermoleophilia bacterium]